MGPVAEPEISITLVPGCRQVSLLSSQASFTVLAVQPEGVGSVGEGTAGVGDDAGVAGVPPDVAS